MESSPPPNSASFDALWESLDAGEEDLPPALAPSLQGKLLPQDERDTVIPPGPPDEYMRGMSQLGELDDPMDLPLVPGNKAAPLGPVRATEREMLLDDPPRRAAFTMGDAPSLPARSVTMGDTSRSPARREAGAPQPSPGYRRRSTGNFAAVQAFQGGAPAHDTRPAPRAPAEPAPFQGAAARAATPLPIPRAPSVPPEEVIDPFAELDTVEGIDSLDGLDAFAAGVGQTSQPSPRAFSLTDTIKPAPQRSLRRDTPAALSVPVSSKPAPSSTRRAPAGPAGLRLGKRTPTPLGMARVQGPDAGQLDPPPSEPAPSSVLDRAREMTALFQARNYPNALVLAESVLVSAPNHAEARRCADACRETLTEKYLGNLGGRDHVLHVAMGAEELRWLSLDHRAGFLLSFIDGSMSIDEVLDVSSMPELDALRIMFELRQQGVIEVVEPNRRPSRR